MPRVPCLPVLKAVCPLPPESSWPTVPFFQLTAQVSQDQRASSRPPETATLLPPPPLPPPPSPPPLPEMRRAPPVVLIPAALFFTCLCVPYRPPPISPGQTTALGGRDPTCFSPAVLASRTGAASSFVKTPRHPLRFEPAPAPPLREGPECSRCTQQEKPAGQRPADRGSFASQ